MATSAKGNGEAAPEEKLEWLFDHVYDKVINLNAIRMVYKGQSGNLFTQRDIRGVIVKVL